METTNETVIWEGNPSQLTNFGTYLALLVLHAVPNGLALREQIRANVERLRVQKSVREVDFAPER
jgi:hypothetical protein